MWFNKLNKHTVTIDVEIPEVFEENIIQLISQVEESISMLLSIYPLC